MHEKLMKIDYCNLRFCVFGVMCLLTLFYAAVSVGNGFLGDSIRMVMIIHLISLVFLTLLLWYFLFKRKSIESMGYFTLFLFNVFLAVFFSALIDSVHGMPSHARQMVMLSNIDYFVAMTMFLTLWLYQKRFLEETIITKTVTVLISAAVTIYTAAIIVNQFKPVLFLVTKDGVYSDAVTDYISVIVDLFCLVSLLAATLFSKLSSTRKLSFICCIFSPLLFTVLSINMDVLSKYSSVWGLLTLVFMMPICLMFFNANDELEKDNLRYEKEQVQLQVSAMISQMQPHFLYNSLSVIAALCEEDPSLAAEATNAFSDYLRENINFADKSNPISFSEELNHIKTYAWLETLRFPNKLSVEYDINCSSFPVPALSVQPIVENAIKHGICKTQKGGTVKIRSSETDEYYRIVVSDDGIGFDASLHLDDGKRHVGIRNSRYRIREMVGGSLAIASTPGDGTTVTITIPKK